MESLYLTLVGITLLFVIFLIFKEFLSKKSKDKFCVICFSVSLTWIILLVLYFTAIFTDKIIIAILMGQTSLGLFYLFYEKLNVFKLPFLLTLIAVIYFILESFEIKSLFLLAGLWILFFIIFIFKSNKKLSNFANKIIECCKKW
jgi:hypothetical protein